MLPSDIDSCAHLVSQTMGSAEADQALETFRFHFSCLRHGIDDGRTYRVLEHSAAILGLVGLHRYIWGPPENVWLAWFAVHPDHQGRGLGAFLLNAAINEARQLRFTRLFIETYSTPEFASARRFYRSHGFKHVGSIESYLPGDGDMLVFLKTLTQPP